MVRINEGQTKALGKTPTDGCFASPHQAHEHDMARTKKSTQMRDIGLTGCLRCFCLNHVEHGIKKKCFAPNANPE